MAFTPCNNRVPLGVRIKEAIPPSQIIQNSSNETTKNCEDLSLLLSCWAVRLSLLLLGFFLWGEKKERYFFSLYLFTYWVMFSWVYGGARSSSKVAQCLSITSHDNFLWKYPAFVSEWVSEWVQACVFFVWMGLCLGNLVIFPNMHVCACFGCFVRAI